MSKLLKELSKQEAIPPNISATECNGSTSQTLVRFIESKKEGTTRKRAIEKCQEYYDHVFGLKLDDELVSPIKTSIPAYNKDYSTPIEAVNIIRGIIKDTLGKSPILFEPTSCIGSDSMALTQLFSMSYLCELNPCSLNALIHNMGVVSSEGASAVQKINYEIYGGNCFDKIRDLYTKQVPITHIYFDPPWGCSKLTMYHLTMEYKGNKYTIPDIIEVLFTVFKSLQYVFLKYPPMEKRYKELDYNIQSAKSKTFVIEYKNKKTGNMQMFNLIQYTRN